MQASGLRSAIHFELAITWALPAAATLESTRLLLLAKQRLWQRRFVGGGEGEDCSPPGSDRSSTHTTSAAKPADIWRVWWLNPSVAFSVSAVIAGATG
jgi:hypothetical protein